MKTTPFRGFRFPKAIIQHEIWLYLWTSGDRGPGEAIDGNLLVPAKAG